jgi:hypothetical protein
LNKAGNKRGAINAEKTLGIKDASYRISARHSVGDNRKNPFVVYLLKTIVY